MTEMTLRQAYCQRHGCAENDFGPRFMAEVLYPQARLLMRLIGASALRFETDLALVTYCGELRTETEIENELRIFAVMPENQQFVRRVLKIRVSGRRFARLAERCGLIR